MKKMNYLLNKDDKITLKDCERKLEKEISRNKLT